jgi:glutathione S-transferase
MLTLFHHGSSACAAKVRFALAEKRLDWESRYIDIMRGEQFSADYVALNPKAVVPTLVHNDSVIVESTVICEYLDEVFQASPLMPIDPVQRASVRCWTKAVDEELHPACSAVTYVVSHRHTILRNGAGNHQEFLAQGRTEGRAARERKWQWLQKGLEAPGVPAQLEIYAGYLGKMDRDLEGRDWLVGECFSMADVAMAPYVYRLAILSMDAIWRDGRLTRVNDWFTRIQARPAFTKAFDRWMPKDLAAEMRANGRKAWPEVEAMLDL